MIYLLYALAVLRGWGELVLAFFVGTALLGYFGVEEIILPAWLVWAPRLLLAPLYGFKAVDATTSGYCTVFYTTLRPIPNDLRVHEAFHRYQQTREAPKWLPARLGVILGPLVYEVKYLWDYFENGYKNNRFEREARRAAGQEV